MSSCVKYISYLFIPFGVVYFHEFMAVEGLVAGGGGPDTSHRVVAGGGRLGGRRG